MKLQDQTTFWMMGLVAVSAFGSVWSQEAFEPSLFYSQACAVCHGQKGEGLPPGSPLLATFASPPADFTDPLFNSREPRADWRMVILHGGSPMGLSSQMPSFEGALNDQQVDEMVEFLKSLSDARAYPPGDLNFLRPIESIKAFPEDEALLIGRYRNNDGRKDELLHTLEVARRIGPRFQGEILISYLNRDGNARLEEVELGFKWAAISNLDRMLLLTGGLELEIPIADRSESESLVPYFSFAKELSSEFTLQGTVRSALPLEDAGEGDLRFSSVLHWVHSPWGRGVFPGLEGTVNVPYDGGRVTGSLIPQAYIGLSRAGHIALSLGFEIPLNNPGNDYGVRWFLLWDFADGPFWKGW